MQLFLSIALITLSLSFFSEAALAVQPGDVVINEVAWMGTQASVNDEWIELFNSTDGNIDLTGWTLSAADGSPTIVLSGSIPTKGFFLLERTDDNTIKNVSADQIYTGALSNSGETLILKDLLGNTIDTANNSGGSWPAGDNAGKLTMERISAPTADIDTNWANNDSTIRNGLDANDNAINGTPKALNSASNQPPVCVDISLDVIAGNAVSVSFSTLCDDPENDALTFTINTHPNQGPLNCNGLVTQCTYFSNANFSGSDSFTFRAEDSFGNTTLGVVVVNVTIPTFDPPSENFFVDMATGSDANDGLTPATAFASIQKGVDSATNGGKVIVLGGVYIENITISKSLTLEAVPSATVRGGQGAAFTVAADNVEIVGFSIQDTDQGILILSGTNNVELHRNAFVNNGIGIENQSGNSIKAENNWWRCNGGPAQSGCDTTLGLVDFNPWLIASLDAVPNPVSIASSTTITLDLARNSDGVIVSNPLTRPISIQANMGVLSQASSSSNATNKFQRRNERQRLVANFLILIGSVWVGVSAILRNKPRRKTLMTLLILIVMSVGGCAFFESEERFNVPQTVSSTLTNGVIVITLSSPLPVEVMVTATVDGQSLMLNVVFVIERV